MNINARLALEKQIMETELSELKRSVANDGRGRLCLRGNRRFYEFRDININGRRTSTSQRLINEKEVFEIQRQKIIRARIKAIETNLRLLRRVNGRFVPFNENAVRARLPVGYRTVTQYESDLRQSELDIWLKAPYRKYDKPLPENINKTAGGIRTRSLGEANIGTALEAFNIPYHYEQTLTLKDANGYKVTRYPDFTILCGDGSNLYWEHAGMLSSDSYRQAHVEKLGLYDLNDIIVGRNLVITGGGKNGSMDLEELYEFIKGFIMRKVFL